MSRKKAADKPRTRATGKKKAPQKTVKRKASKKKVAAKSKRRVTAKKPADKKTTRGAASKTKKAKKKTARKKTAKTRTTKRKVGRKVAKKAPAKRASRKTAKKTKKAPVKKAKKAAKKAPVRKAKKAAKKAPAKKAKKAAKKAPAKKAKKTAKAATKRKKPPEVVEPEEPGLPLKEIRARLGLIGPQIGEFDWLEGLYLYGAALVEVERLERVDFIVVHRGLRNATRLRSAEAALRDLFAAVLPLEAEFKFTGTLEIGRLLAEGNPAAQALLGYSEAVFVRQ